MYWFKKPAGFAQRIQLHISELLTVRGYSFLKIFLTAIVVEINKKYNLKNDFVSCGQKASEKQFFSSLFFPYRQYTIQCPKVAFKVVFEVKPEYGQLVSY